MRIRLIQGRIEAADRTRTLMSACLVATGLLAHCWGAGVRLGMRQSDTSGWAWVQSEGHSNQVHVLQGSSDFKAWKDVAIMHDGPFAFADATAPGSSHRFYKAVSRSRTAADDGKNLVHYPLDPFRSPPTGLPGDAQWVKFAIILSDPARVWFQHSTKYLFHYDYAVQRLDPFKGMTRQQFDDVSLWRTNQQVLLGAVLYAPDDAGAEYAIQFAGLEPYPREDIVTWVRLVRSCVFEDEAARVFYMPVIEQAALAEEQRAWFESQGVPVARPERWQLDDSCYSTGWALGRLVFVSSDQIAEAYADGRLRPTDILLTDGVPAEVPYVAGIVSSAPATPNSHVAILARSYRVPFVYIATEAQRAKIGELAGRKIALDVRVELGYAQTTFFEIDPALSPELEAGILALKNPGPIAITPKERFGAISADTSGLMPSDIRFVGGKAANFGLLRRAIPNNSPSAIAFSFDLWDDFLDQVLAGSGKTLRQEIRERTAGYSYPPDIPAVQTDLAAIRDLIRRTADFTAAQQEQILEALSVFDANRKIRFRSSTNVEDSEQFTGAGLYDSYSGCLADDLDGDSDGPSQCDPDEPSERGAFRAMRRVYASFYNDNAWLERLRVGLIDDQVGMAILAHHSFPDEDEMANGVATLRYEKGASYSFYAGQLVSQISAISVTNPEEGAQAEVVDFSKYRTTVILSTVEHSNLVPLGANVMVWNNDYRSLLNLLVPVTDAYAALFPAKSPIYLDFEYKKVQPGQLVVKQVREIPPPGNTNLVAPYVLNERVTYCALQGEYGDVFANHRLKCILSLNTRNLLVTESNLTASLYTGCSIEFLEGTNVTRWIDGPAAWPQARFSLAGDTASDIWESGSGSPARTFALETTLRRSVELSHPLLTQRDLAKSLRVEYAEPVPRIDPEGTVTKTSEEEVQLAVRSALTPQCLLQNRAVTGRGVKIETSFYWPEPPRGIVAGYTAPLLEWVETKISGLTSEPVLLRNAYSQTYRPAHHNFMEEFIFQPDLEPHVTPGQLRELGQANIRLIYVVHEEGADRVFAMSPDGLFRRL